MANLPRFRVYLAGPDVFYADAESRYARLKALCEAHGLEGVAPIDGLEELQDQTPVEARIIRDHCLRLQCSCHATLANITPYRGLEPDSGTAYEMGHASAIGHAIASYCYDGLDTRSRILRAGRLLDRDGRDDDGLLVERFGLYANAMLCADHPAFNTPLEAIQSVLEQLLRANREAA